MQNHKRPQTAKAPSPQHFCYSKQTQENRSEEDVTVGQQYLVMQGPQGPMS